MKPQTMPVGWDRLADEADWVRAHLVNGRLGGPGLSWNLVPTPTGVNNDMNTEYEDDCADESAEGWTCSGSRPMSRTTRTPLRAR